MFISHSFTRMVQVGW